MVSDCSIQVNVTKPMMNDSAGAFYFVPNRANFLYILRNANYDVMDIHQYGLWNTIPAVLDWIKDSVTNRPVWFLEGGGPFCTFCETFSSQADLLMKNSSYVVYYFITGIEQNVGLMSWHLSPEYKSFSDEFGDMDLQDSTYSGLPFMYNKRQSFYSYQFLAKDIFSSIYADSVIKIAEASNSIYHYRILPLGLDVVWSTLASENFVINGTGSLFRWDIPTIAGDSVVDQSSISVSGSTTLNLQNGIPVFYSWNDVIGLSEYETTINKVQMFPNPFKNTINVKLTNSLPLVEIKIYDALGNICYHQKYENENSFEIVLTNLANGLYYCSLFDGVSYSVKKIIKQ